MGRQTIPVKRTQSKLTTLWLILSAIALVWGLTQKTPAHGIPIYPYIPATWQYILDLPGEMKVPANTRAMILPHDSLTYEDLNKTYRGWSKTVQPEVVVVLAPNHYEKGEGNIQVNGESYQTIKGNLEIDQVLVQSMVQAGAATREDETFAKEHGVSMHAAYIKEYFPKAQILPIVFKKKTSEAEVNKLVTWLHDHLPANSIVVASIDFSHYLPRAQANINDKRTGEAVMAVDPSKVPTQDEPCAYLDSPTGLKTFLLYMKAGDWQPKLLKHDNSADILNKSDLNSTTGHFYVSFAKRPI